MAGNHRLQSRIVGALFVVMFWGLSAGNAQGQLSRKPCFPGRYDYPYSWHSVYVPQKFGYGYNRTCWRRWLDGSEEQEPAPAQKEQPPEQPAQPPEEMLPPPSGEEGEEGMPEEDHPPRPPAMEPELPPSHESELPPESMPSPPGGLEPTLPPTELDGADKNEPKDSSPDANPPGQLLPPPGLEPSSNPESAPDSEPEKDSAPGESQTDEPQTLLPQGGAFEISSDADALHAIGASFRSRSIARRAHGSGATQSAPSRTAQWIKTDDLTDRESTTEEAADSALSHPATSGARSPAIEDSAVRAATYLAPRSDDDSSVRQSSHLATVPFAGRHVEFTAPGSRAARENPLRADTLPGETPRARPTVATRQANPLRGGH